MVFTRTSVFTLIAFILALLASLVSGGLITSSDLSFGWLLSGAAASYFLGQIILVP